MKVLFLSFALMLFASAAPAAEQALQTAAKTDIYAGIKTAFDAFAVDCGRYPMTSEGFAAMIVCPTNIPAARWHGPYFDRIPRDPWGNEYVYRFPGSHNTNGIDLYSCGFDGISKSGGDDLDDINNWDPGSPHGGNDRFRNRWQLFLNSPVFQLFVLATILVSGSLGGIRLVGSFFSQRIRDSINRHPIVHIIWFAAFLWLFWFLLQLMPRI